MQKQTPPATVTVLSEWISSYPAPISFEKGDPLTLSGRRDLWDGHLWLWAIDLFGKEGWIPDTSRYSAQELTCEAGQTLSVKWQTHGWSWCENTSGYAGWVPNRCISFT